MYLSLLFVFVFTILYGLFLAALWLPARIGLPSWLSCMWCFSCFFCHFTVPCLASGVVHDLSIPAL